MVKNLPANAGDLGFLPWIRKIPWRREWLPTPIFLPGEFPWTEEPGELQSLDSQRVGHNRATNTFTFQKPSKGKGQFLKPC